MDFENLKNRLLMLLGKKENVVIAIEGKSGIGKTKIIKELKSVYGSNMTVLTSEKFISIIIMALKSDINPSTAFSTIETSIMVIEDMDFGLKGKQIMQKSISYILKDMLNHHKIIITGIELNERIPDLMKNIDKCLCLMELE